MFNFLTGDYVRSKNKLAIIFLLLVSFSSFKFPHFAFALGELTQTEIALQVEEIEAKEEEEAIIEQEEENELNAAAGEDVAVQTGTIDPSVPFDGTSLADNLVDLSSDGSSSTTTISSNVETLATTAQVSAGEQVSVGTGDTTVTADAGATQTVTTEDLTEQPEDKSLIDKVVDIFTGGEEESQTTVDAGIGVSTGETQVGTEADADLGFGGGQSIGTVTETTETTTETTTTAEETVGATQPPTQAVSETETQTGGSTSSSKRDEVASQSEKTKDQRSILEQISGKFLGKASLPESSQRPIVPDVKQGSGENCADTEGEDGNIAANCAENKSR